jgi:hypothetical protein
MAFIAALQKLFKDYETLLNAYNPLGTPSLPHPPTKAPSLNNTTAVATIATTATTTATTTTINFSNIDHQNIDEYLNDFQKNCGPGRRSITGNGEEYDTNIKPYVSRLCDVLPLSNVDNIFGPHRYTEYSFKPPNEIGGIIKKIGVFGEYHFMLNTPNFFNKYDDRRTLTINSFLKSLLLSNSTKVYDLYLETEFISKSIPIRQNVWEGNFSLHLLNKDFEKCFQIDKTLCEYRNLRAHYMDYRNAGSEENIKKIIELYQNTDDNNKTEVLKQLLEYILKLPKIKKQLEANVMQQKIIEFLRKKVDEVLKKAYTTEYITEYKVTYKLSPIQVFINCLIMDAYILGRLFKRQSMIDQENIIIYVGDAHSVLYCEFLESIGFTKTLNIDVAYHYNEEKKRRDYDQIIHFTQKDKEKSFLFLN